MTLGLEVENRCGSYTIEEQRAIQEMYSMMDADEEMRNWRKYAAENLLIIGLRACDMDVSKAFKTMKSLHTHATITYPELFHQIDPQNLKPVIEKRLFQVVKRPVDKGPAILVFRIRNWKPSEAGVEQLVLTGALYLYAVANISPEIQREGLIVVVDVAGFRFAHARQASVDLLVKACRIYSTIPRIVKGVQIINSLPMFETCYNLFKFVMSENIRNLINITKDDLTYLSNLVDVDKLPREFWGTIPDNEAYVENIEADILRDPLLINLIKHLQDDIIGLNIQRKQ